MLANAAPSLITKNGCHSERSEENSSSAGASDMNKSKAPRFEAYVMTGDAILNLSRTTHSPEFYPYVGKTKRASPQEKSTSVPNSPSEVNHNGTKPWDKTSTDVNSTHSNLVYSSPAMTRNSRSDDTLHTCAESDNNLRISSEHEEEKNFSYNALMDATTAKENDRIVWTYNAPLTEQELRKLEADQFWLTHPKMPVKAPVSQERVTPPAESLEAAEDILETAQVHHEVAEEEIAALPEEDSPRSLSSTPSLDEDSDADSLQFHYSPKAVDQPSAERLAKRLFALDGFQKSDVSRHLSKNNDFSKAVAEEYLKLFDFQGKTLDSALRQFLQAFQLTGESSERDRVLVHFSQRFCQCNPNSFSSQDSVHILTCALLLLNSDLHGKHPGLKRMSCTQFVKRLSGLNNGGNFPADLLRRLYNSIKTQPLEWASDAETPDERAPLDAELEAATPAKELASNPYLEIPVPVQSRDFKQGYVMRKCCVEPNGKRTAFGKRGWRMFFAVLKDLVLYLYKDEATCKGEVSKTGTLKSRKNSVEPGPAAVVRVHHALAASAPDYTKKQNVFRLFTADGAQFLIQTSDAKECRSWMDSFNTAAALLSAPPLPAPVGSQQRFEKPLLPSALSRLGVREQLRDTEERLALLEAELRQHRANPLAKNAKSSVIHSYREKDAYLHFEIARYQAYVSVLRSVMSTSMENNDFSLSEVDERLDSGAASPETTVN